MTSIHQTEHLADQAAGNWRNFHCFAWFDRPADAYDWCVVYTHNRDSGLLDQSNAAAIAKELEPFLEEDEPDVISQRHSHWACGWIDGYAIRVRRDGDITEAFKTWCDLRERLDHGSVLDEGDYSQRQYDATIDNIRAEGRVGSTSWARAQAPFDPATLPDDWPERVYDWLADHAPGTIENRDDQGGYPWREKITEALRELGLLK